MHTLRSILITCLLLFTYADILHGQWVQSHGVYGGYIRAFAVSGTNLFAGTAGGGIFLSTNNGTSWTQVNTGLTNTSVRAIAVSGTSLFAGTRGGGVFLSTDNGTSWTQVNTGLTSADVRFLAISGTNLFAGTRGGFFAGTPDGGVFLSTNNGTSWTQVNTGLTNTNVQSLAISGTNLFAGTRGDGVWRRPLSEMITSLHLSSSDHLPGEFSLEQNYPNPFNPSTNIGFAVPVGSFVSLKLYDLLGRAVATLVSEVLAPGSYEVTFDGVGLASGIYFYRLQAGPFVQTRKLVLQK